MWISVCLNWEMNFNTKNDGKKSFSYETKALMSFISMRRMSLWCPITKRKEITMWIHVCPNWQMNFNTKNDGKKSFSYLTRALMPFIPIREMSLWCPIMKIKEINMWINVYPNWKMNFDSKNGRKGGFSYETKASKSFITIRRLYLQFPIRKRKEIIMWIRVCPNRWMDINFKNSRKRSFSYETKHEYLLSQWGECVYDA